MSWPKPLTYGHIFNIGIVFVPKCTHLEYSGKIKFALPVNKPAFNGQNAILSALLNETFSWIYYKANFQSHVPYAVLYKLSLNIDLHFGHWINLKLYFNIFF